eukprot:scpid68723/ scgid15405/ 
MGGCGSTVSADQPAAQHAKAPDKRLTEDINNKLRAWVKEAAGNTGPDGDVEFDEDTKQDKVDLSNGNRTAAYMGKGYSTTLLKTTALEKGRFAFSVFVDLSRIRSWMQIGVVTTDRKEKGCPQVFDGTPHPFREGELALRSDGALLTGKKETSDGPDMNRAERAYDTGDIISVQIDLDARKIEWFKNNESVKTSDLLDEQPVYPCVSLDNPKEQVTLLASFACA